METLIDAFFTILESELWRRIAVAILMAGLMGLAMGLYIGAVFWKTETSPKKKKEPVEFRSAKGTFRKQGLLPFQLRNQEFTLH